MKINFIYNKEKDIWCILNKGKGSNNSNHPTKQYSELVLRFGENPTIENTSIFIDQYITKNQIDIQNRIESYKKQWELISDEFCKRAELIFGIVIPESITAYITINSRCPYSIQDNFFFVSTDSDQILKIIMHELWHFYTWYGVGIDQEKELEKKKYNDLKESLTVLLNIECKDLLPEGAIDYGYPQHQELRNKIIEWWKENQDIDIIWEKSKEYILENKL